jgi:hypothetical protein
MSAFVAVLLQSWVFSLYGAVDLRVQVIESTRAWPFAIQCAIWQDLAWEKHYFRVLYHLFSGKVKLALWTSPLLLLAEKLAVEI